MADLPAYRNVLGSIWFTPTWRRLMQMLSAEEGDVQRLSAIMEVQKIVGERLRQSLTKERKKTIYEENLEFEAEQAAERAKMYDDPPKGVSPERMAELRAILAKARAVQAVKRAERKAASELHEPEAE